MTSTQAIPYYIGLDIGTSSAKAVAFSLQGEVLAQFSESYPLEQPEPDAAVQDAELIRQAVLKSLREITARQKNAPLGIGLSSAMHSLMAVDEAGQPLSRLVTWADGRARAQAEALKTTALGQALYRQSGTPVHAMSPLCKLAWWQQTQADLYRQAARFIGIKEYVLYHSCGAWQIDHSLASATGLFDLQKRQWIPEALAYLGLTPDRFSQPVAGHQVLPPMRASAAAETGLPPETPWVIGASDGCLANLGTGIIQADQAVLTIGTSGAIRMTVPEAVYDPERRLFCYILDEQHYVIGGPSNNGGVVWEWFCRQFFPDTPMEQVFKAVAGIPPGADGLLFLPYLFGERAPVWNAAAKGYFWDIEANHSRAHFARAVLEGICLNLYQIMLALQAVGGPIHRIHANGGFVQSDLWVQLLADILGKEILIGENPHASAWGAAIMAMQATGQAIPDISHSSNKVYRPDMARHQIYQQIFERFLRIYPSANVS